MLAFAFAHLASAESKVTHLVLVRADADFGLCTLEIANQGFEVIKTMPLVGVVSIRASKPVEPLLQLSCVEMLKKNETVVIVD